MVPFEGICLPGTYSLPLWLVSSAFTFIQRAKIPYNDPWRQVHSLCLVLKPFDLQSLRTAFRYYLGSDFTKCRCCVFLCRLCLLDTPQASGPCVPLSPFSGQCCTSNRHEKESESMAVKKGLTGPRMRERQRRCDWSLLGGQ